MSSCALRFLSGLMRGRHVERETRWRRLTAGRQALPALAHLRYGDTYSRLAAGLGVGTTVYRYATKAVELRSSSRRSWTTPSGTRARTKAYAILDGTLLPIDRFAAGRSFLFRPPARHPRRPRRG
ncbi:hypothetical protein [Streptomyces sp. NPDC048248]|uniref:hypothetical protein n=1 Tax=Streptomyces sp. NPDC048248 TaxID=3365523 RepID=UPI003722C89B